MNGVDRVYEDLEVGHYVVFHRSFELTDFQQFAKLSGDSSPIHHILEYAARTEFGNCLVPVFLYSSPVSAVAGMFMPGHRSLIVKTTINSTAPLFYGQEVTYSSKIISKSDHNDVLTIRTIAFADSTIVLDVETLVQVRTLPSNVEDQWKVAGHLRSNTDDQVLLITGATSSIGSAIALRAARQGKHLVLCYHSNQETANALKSAVKQFGVDVYTRSLKQLSKNSNYRLKREKWYSRVDSMVHAYSAPIDSDLTDLVNSNYAVLKDLVGELMPSFLEKQFGRVLNLGSSIIFRHTQGYSDYEAAKIASTNFTTSVNQKFGNYGVQCCTLAPDIVDTNFSKSMLGTQVEKILPEEVAEKCVNLLFEKEKWKPEWVWITTKNEYAGDFQISNSDSNSRELSPNANDDILQNIGDTKANELIDQSTKCLVQQIVSDVLRVDLESIGENSGLTRTPGWDSFRHIEIIVAIEKALQIRFSSESIGQIETIGELIGWIESTLRQKKA